MPKAEALVRSLLWIHRWVLKCSAFQGSSRDWDPITQAAAKLAVIHYAYLCPRKIQNVLKGAIKGTGQRELR